MDRNIATQNRNFKSCSKSSRYFPKIGWCSIENWSIKITTCGEGMVVLFYSKYLSNACLYASYLSSDTVSKTHIKFWLNWRMEKQGVHHWIFSTFWVYGNFGNEDMGYKYGTLSDFFDNNMGLMGHATHQPNILQTSPFWQHLPTCRINTNMWEELTNK